MSRDRDDSPRPMSLLELAFWVLLFIHLGMTGSRIGRIADAVEKMAEQREVGR